MEDTEFNDLLNRIIQLETEKLSLQRRNGTVKPVDLQERVRLLENDLTNNGNLGIQTFAFKSKNVSSRRRKQSFADIDDYSGSERGSSYSSPFPGDRN